MNDRFKSMIVLMVVLLLPVVSFACGIFFVRAVVALVALDVYQSNFEMEPS